MINIDPYKCIQCKHIRQTETGRFFCSARYPLHRTNSMGAACALFTYNPANEYAAKHIYSSKIKETASFPETPKAKSQKVTPPKKSKKSKNKIGARKVKYK